MCVLKHALQALSIITEDIGGVLAGPRRAAWPSCTSVIVTQVGQMCRVPQIPGDALCVKEKIKRDLIPPKDRAEALKTCTCVMVRTARQNFLVV